MRRKVYKRVVQPAILFGLETLTKIQETDLEVAELNILGFSLRVTRMEMNRNEHRDETFRRQS